MRPDKHNSPLQIHERRCDFASHKGTVVYSGTCCCTCCCCLWTIGGLAGGLIGYKIARPAKQGSAARISPCLFRSFKLGGWIAVGLSLFAATIFAIVGQGLKGIGGTVGFLVVAAPLLVFPFGLGGILGAWGGKRALRKRDPSLSADDLQISMKPVWLTVLAMWGGAIIGTIIGFAPFVPALL